MRTSTKIFLIFYLITLVGVILTSSFFFSSLTITAQGLAISFNTLTYISLIISILNIVFGTILYVRFLKSQKLTATLFFSVVPTTLLFATATYFLATINNYQNQTVEIVRNVLQINQTNANNFLWVIIFTIIYLFIIFFLFKIITKPIKRVEVVLERLSDGNIKDKIFIGGGKQFQKMEYNLNKINDNYRKKESIIKETTTEYDKYIPKQFIKFLGKNSVLDLVVGTQVTKEVTTLFCDVRNSSQVSTSLSLEENFNYINSYLNVVSPIIKKYNGFIDKFLGDGIMAVFTRSRQAYDCSLAIIKAIKEKNESNINMPRLEVGVALNTSDVVFGVVGDENRKSITILSEAIDVTNKISDVNKMFGSFVAFSKATLTDLSANLELNYRYIGNIKVGKEYISVFESLDAYPRAKKEKLIKNKVLFEQGVRAYVNGKFEQAKKIFEEVYKKEKEDKVCYVFYNKSDDKINGD